MKEVEFYFDFSSPNAYCAFVQLKRLETDYELQIELKPVFLGGIMNELETTPPAMQNQVKADYLLMDLDRWTDFYDIPFKFPPDFPVDSLRALRGFLFLEEQANGILDEYTKRIFRAAWVEEHFINEESVLRDCLPEEISTERFFDEIKTPRCKEELKERTAEALDRGVFGCPTIYVDNEPFWGKDRFRILEDRLGS